MRSTSLVLLTLCTAPCAHAGAWGYGTFDNDDALDWLSELESTSRTHCFRLQYVKSIRERDMLRPRYAQWHLHQPRLSLLQTGIPRRTSSRSDGVDEACPPDRGAALLVEARTAVRCVAARSSELRELAGF